MAAFPFGYVDPVALEQLVRQIVVGLRTAGARVIERHGFAVTGCLRQTDVAGDGGLKELIAEEAPQVVADLLGEVGAVVKHGEQHAFQREYRVETTGDAVQRGHELGDAFEGEVLGLHGDEQGIGRDQCVERQQVQRGRAVEQDEGIFGCA